MIKPSAFDLALHSDGRATGKPRFDLAARPHLPQSDRAAPIEADDAEGMLASINPHRGNRRD
jgi:hypothetical protein